MITCEDLDQNSCAFAVSSSGYRCVLEMKLKRSGYVELFCRTSDIEAEKVKNYVENDECIKACGLDRNTVGISSDSLLDSRFTQKLCSHDCYNTCSNIVDLYFNLAAGEGAFLPKLCEDQETNVRRGIAEIQSSGIEAARPVSVFGKSVAFAPSALVEEDLATEPAESPC
ncbi:PAR1 protein [Dioscorea alata]|uniref:PAR1 protein n=1 Tax=Dioscorea alata TaxID=55571 RepID=A0ACB7UQH4_DIOAL|nr:PAR1 protein [Dioscorea alata]